MATLKISDLSVGDWVRYDDRICQIAEIYHLTYNLGSKKMTSFPRVTLFYEDDMPTYHESAILNDIHPIPITAEILEKNGFERSTSQFIVYHTDKVWISHDEPSETWSVTVYINDVTSNLHANILHIHQLQHTLRLAGVDKEINL